MAANANCARAPLGWPPSRLARAEPAPKLSRADFAEIKKEFAAQIAAAMTSASEIQNTTRKMSFSVVLALLLLVIAVPIASFSANASFGPGMFLALLLLLCSSPPSLFYRPRY